MTFAARMTLFTALLTHFAFSGDVACAADSLPENEVVRTIVTRDASVSIPFKLASGRNQTHLQLFGRTAGGGIWRKLQEVSSTAREFRPNFSDDGIFELAIRPAESSERSHVPLTADLRVVVDRKKPSIEIGLSRLPDGMMQADVRVTDANIDHRTFEISVDALEGDSHRKRALQVQTRAVENASSLRSVTRWTPSEFPTVVRVTVVDLAGNRATANERTGPFNLPEVTAAERATAKSPVVIVQVDGEALEPLPAPPRVFDADAIFPKASAKPKPRVAIQLEPTMAQGSGRLVPDVREPPGLESPAFQKPVPQPTETQLTPEDATRRDILLRSARNAVALGEVETALERFEALLQIDPDLESAREEYAGLLVQADRIDDARAEYAQLIERSATPDRYRLALVDLMIGQQEFVAAQEVLEDLLASPVYRQQAAVKLAKTFAWQQQLDEAIRIYDEYLSDLNGTLSNDDAMEIAQLLLDMGRPAEALPHLLRIHAAEPQNEEVLTSIILAYVRSGSRTVALNRVQQVAEGDVVDSQIWQELANKLYREFAFPEALAVFELIAREFPGYTPAQIGMARAHLRLYQTVAAKNLLADLAPELSMTKPFQTAIADYHTVVGEYSEAIAISHQRLRRNPQDAEAFILLGNAYRASRRFPEAERAYQLALSSPTQAPELIEEVEWLLAKNAFEAKRPETAAEILHGLLARRPQNIAARLQLVDVLIELRRFDEAEALVVEVLHAPDIRERHSLHRSLGDVLLERGLASDAMREYELGLLDTDLVTPQLAYGLYRANHHLGNHGRALDALQLGPTQFHPAADWTITIARLAIRDCDCKLAQTVLGELLAGSPENLAGLLTFGAATAQCDGCCKLPHDRSGCGGSCCSDGQCGSGSCGTGLCTTGLCGTGKASACSDGSCGQHEGCGGSCGGGSCGRPHRYDASRERAKTCGPFEHCPSDGGNPAAIHYESALALSPNNVEAHLGLARSKVKHQQYEASLSIYEKARQLVPDDVNLQREMARVVDGWRGYNAAAPYYRSPHGRRYETLAARHSGPLADSGPRAINGHAGSSRTPIATQYLPGVAAFGNQAGYGFEFQSATAEQLLATESHAKYLRGFRDRHAIPVYEGLIDLEPTNEEAYFDLGQIHAAANNSQCAIEMYERLFEINPCHREAAIAWERELLELRPQLRAGFDYVSQTGRDGLADLRSGTYSLIARFPFANADEYVDVGYRFINLRPSNGPDNNGHAAVLGGQKRLRPYWWLFGEIDVEEYDYGFSTRPNFIAGTRARSSNEFTFEIAAILDNIAVNRESIVSDIYKVGLQATADWKPSRPVDLGAYYRWFDYSDDNRSNEFGFEAAYRLIDGQYRLRAIGNFDFITFSEQSTPGPVPNNIAGTTHPYFAPNGFSFVSVGVEWKHWLSCDRFVGADELYYQLYLGARFDSESDSYFLFRGSLNYDIRNWLTWQFGVTQTSSPAFDETTVSSNLIIRFR